MVCKEDAPLLSSSRLFLHLPRVDELPGGDKEKFHIPEDASKRTAGHARSQRLARRPFALLRAGRGAQGAPVGPSALCPACSWGDSVRHADTPRHASPVCSTAGRRLCGL